MVAASSSLSFPSAQPPGGASRAGALFLLRHEGYLPREHRHVFSQPGTVFLGEDDAPNIGEAQVDTSQRPPFTFNIVVVRIVFDASSTALRISSNRISRSLLLPFPRAVGASTLSLDNLPAAAPLAAPTEGASGL